MPNHEIPPGLWPVMLTPFHDDGRIDWAAFDALTDWYIESGADGLFAVSGSSEVHHLAREERVALAERALARTAGRIPVAASAIVFESLEHQAEAVREMFDTGVQFVIVGTCQLAGPHEGADIWTARAEGLLEMTGEIPLGLYEIPTPYKRLLTDEQCAWAAATGRFVFLKDTCCDVPTMRRRLEAFRSSRLKLYNANTPTLLESLDCGAAGFCGIGANYCPRLYAWLCRHHAAAAQAAAEVQRFLTRFDPLIESKYPAGCKRFLGQLGLPIGPRCRIQTEPITPEDEKKLSEFAAAIREIESGLERAVGGECRG